MIKFDVVESKNWTWYAQLSNGRIKYRGRSLIPIKIEAILDGGLNRGQALGGAIVGAVLLGGVGAVAGGALGAAKGKVTCLVTVAGGDRLVCRTTRAEFPLLHRELLEAVEAAPRQLEIVSTKVANLNTTAPPGFTIAQFLFGPFYLLKFGLWRFLVASAATVGTYGLAWLLMPMWSRALMRQKLAQEHRTLSAELIALRATPVDFSGP